MTNLRSPTVFLVLAAVVQAALVAVFAGWSSGLLDHFPAAIWAMVGMGVPYLFAGWLVGRTRRLDSKAGLLIIFGAALLARALLVPHLPALSDDIYRYLWDGRVQAQGLNPFRYAPSAPALASLRDAWHGRINHPEIPTIYPPTAQIVFLLSSLTWHHPVMLKLAFVACDLLVGWLIWLVLRGRRMSGALVVWYLWNPIVLIETAYSGHMDVLAVLLVVLTFLLVERGKRTAAWVALAFATMAKLYPVFLTPLLYRKGERRGPLAFLLACAALLLPYLGAGRNLFVGLTAYSSGWRFNDGLFGMLARIMPDRAATRLLEPAITPFFEGYGLNHIPNTFLPLTRLAVAAALIALVVWAARRNGRLEAKFSCVLTGLLASSPAVFPWYAIMIVPWFALVKSPEARWGAALWTVLLPMSYWTLPEFRAGGGWQGVPEWVRLVEYGAPIVAACAIYAARKLAPRERPAV